MRKNILAGAELAQHGILDVRLHALCRHLVQGGIALYDHLFHQLCVLFQYDGQGFLVGKDCGKRFVAYEGSLKDVARSGIPDAESAVVVGCRTGNEGRIPG